MTGECALMVPPPELSDVDFLQCFITQTCNIERLLKVRAGMKVQVGEVESENRKE